MKNVLLYFPNNFLAFFPPASLSPVVRATNSATRRFSTGLLNWILLQSTTAIVTSLIQDFFLDLFIVRVGFCHSHTYILSLTLIKGSTTDFCYWPVTKICRLNFRPRCYVVTTKDIIYFLVTKNFRLNLRPACYVEATKDIYYSSVTKICRLNYGK